MSNGLFLNIFWRSSLTERISVSSQDEILHLVTAFNVSTPNLLETSKRFYVIRFCSTKTIVSGLALYYGDGRQKLLLVL